MSINQTADLIMTLIVALASDVIVFSFLKRRWVIISILFFEAMGIVSAFTQMWSLLALSCVSAAVILMASSSANAQEFKFLMANDTKGKQEDKVAKALSGRTAAQNSLEKVYPQIENAVITMSKQHMGAIMTFEKKDNLDNIIDSGSGAHLNAQVTSEIIQALFYPGGRLHDGGMVIRGDRIIAASVFYPPSRREITSKCGSRHRAAYGISEITDSVTILVSEETGKISIFYKGQSILVTPDNLMKIFDKCMHAA
jgi:DNA integrity scanning protein DisA with diadenylate cyclase activity